MKALLLIALTIVLSNAAYAQDKPNRIAETTPIAKLVLSGAEYAQDNQAQDSDRCAGFKMRIVKPDEKLDSKMILQMDGSLDQAMVVNPCPPSKRVATQFRVVPPPVIQRQNAIAPSLKLNPSDGQLKTPAEVLKQFAAPKPDRK